jgi:hypothetical protein
MTTTTFELTIWAEGVCRDAEGNLLDSEGNIVEPTVDDQESEGEES